MYEYYSAMRVLNQRDAYSEYYGARLILVQCSYYTGRNAFSGCNSAKFVLDVTVPCLFWMYLQQCYACSDGKKIIAL